MTRDEHLEWCKTRALEYLPHDPNQALASMLSDLRKHEDFRLPVYDIIGMAGIFEAAKGSEAVRRWVEGFN